MLKPYHQFFSFFMTEACIVSKLR